MTDRQLMFFNPVFKEKIWGGNKLHDIFGYDTDKDNIGECWAISAQPGSESTCTTKGFEGKTLSALWSESPELFGHYDSDRFPLLVKFIDAKEDLSIQVHPSDEYARVHENGSLGKQECWYVCDAPEGEHVILGHNARTREEFNTLVDTKRYDQLLCLKNIKKADFVKIEPGTVHAIMAGTMVLEIQQNSDITYRFYDYDRLENGKPRTLHLEQAKEVINVPETNGFIYSTTDEAGIHELYSCKYFTVGKINVKDTFSFDTNDAFFCTVTCVEGSGTADGKPISAGSNFIVPKGYGTVTFEGNMTLIVSRPE